MPRERSPLLKQTSACILEKEKYGILVTEKRVLPSAAMAVLKIH